MERNKKGHLLLLLLALLHGCIATMDCPVQSSALNCPLPDKIFIDFMCYNDYNRIITCVWNSTHVHTNSVCTVNARKKDANPKSKFAHRTCNLEPVDDSKPLKKCSMDMRKESAFQDFEEWTVELKCNTSNQKISIDFKPSCSIKLNPPGKPHVNLTTVSWSSQVTKHDDIEFFMSQLQWKQKDQSWSDSSVKTKCKSCEHDCETELDENDLIHGESYEARTRVMTSEIWAFSTWSEWSPTTTWESSVGKTKSPDENGGFLVRIITVTVALALCLVVVLFRTHTTTWVVKKIRGPPIPNPATSFLQNANFQDWLNPHFTPDSFHSFLKQEEILYVEVTSAVDAVGQCRPEAALQEKIKSEGSSGSGNSSYSNPSYSHLCPSRPISSLSAGNLQPCAVDTPYGPVGNQGEGENAEQNEEEVRRKEMEISQLLSKGSKDSEPMQVVSDYEKVEKLQAERTRLQSLDSGMCSSEEVSQESLEPDSINVTGSHDEETEEEEERGNGKEADFKKLFGGSGGIFGKGSIQVCSDYERVQKQQADSSELLSVDSGVSSGGEEQASQESVEDVDKSTETTSFLFPPAPSFSLPCAMSSFSQLPLKFSGLGLSPALQPLPSHILDRNVLMSASRSVEPSGDGYMPVKQEQN